MLWINYIEWSRRPYRSGAITSTDTCSKLWIKSRACWASCINRTMLSNTSNRIFQFRISRSNYIASSTRIGTPSNKTNNYRRTFNTRRSTADSPWVSSKWRRICDKEDGKFSFNSKNSTINGMWSTESISDREICTLYTSRKPYSMSSSSTSTLLCISSMPSSTVLDRRQTNSLDPLVYK
jgi:hypothetical protein